MQYIRQIDGLRALAVTAVIAHHWVPDSFKYSALIHFGAYGVDLFFVISGFLITTILLKEKGSGRTFQASLKRFYWRRSLRIFPIYYLYLILIFCIGWSDVSDNALFLLSYTFNLDIYFNGWPKGRGIQHLWSLSVEEQFYLIWPFVVFTFNKKKSLRIIILVLFISFATYMVFFFATKYQELKVFTPYSFISLGLGTLLAYAKDRKFKLKYHSVIIVALFAIIIFLRWPGFHFPGKNVLPYLIPFQSFIFYVVVDKACEGFTGFGKRVLENPVLVYIGRISYGLYLYHMIIPYVTVSLFLSISNNLINVGINTLILLSISILSWQMIEKPIIKMKDNIYSVQFLRKQSSV